MYLCCVRPYSVFLVDHAWTYRMEYARQQLEQVPGLLPRMATLMGIDFHGEAPDPDTVEAVMECMWKYNQTYQLSLGVSAKPPLAISLFTDGQTSSQALTAAAVRAVVERSDIQLSLLNQAFPLCGLQTILASGKWANTGVGKLWAICGS